MHSASSFVCTQVSLIESSYSVPITAFEVWHQCLLQSCICIWFLVHFLRHCRQKLCHAKFASMAMGHMACHCMRRAGPPRD